MAGNPRLNDEELQRANALLDEVRARIHDLARADEDLVFAYRRKLWKELSYDERGKPPHRRRLKEKLMILQEGRCAECKQPMEAKGSVLDRREAKAGYTRENVELLHPTCDRKRQEARGYQ